MQKLAEALGNIHKNFGKEVGGLGVKFAEFRRLPTGIFPLDLGLGGGLPMGAVSIIYGTESSGKTSLCYRAAASFQKRYPGRKVGWLDVENQHDDPWCRLHGVNTDDLVLLKPTSSEQAADMAGELAMSEDTGLLIVDSIAALASYDQLEKDAEKYVVGGATRSSTTMMRKIGGAMVEHVKSGSELTVLYINQVRDKIGFVMGNPEILPGPRFQNFQAFLKLRLAAKPILKEKIAAVPIYAENSARIVKKKFPALRQSMEWETILYPYKDHKPLEVNNHKHMEKVLEELGYLEKSGNDWLLYGEVFQTKTAAVQAALADYDATVKMLVEDMLLLYKEDL